MQFQWTFMRSLVVQLHRCLDNWYSYFILSWGNMLYFNWIHWENRATFVFYMAQNNDLTPCPVAQDFWSLRCWYKAATESQKSDIWLLCILSHCGDSTGRTALQGGLAMSRTISVLNSPAHDSHVPPPPILLLRTGLGSFVWYPEGNAQAIFLQQTSDVMSSFSFTFPISSPETFKCLSLKCFNMQI